MSQKRCREMVTDRVTRRKRRCKLHHLKTSKYCTVHNKPEEKKEESLIKICKFYIAPKPEDMFKNPEIKIKTEKTLKEELEKQLKDKLNDKIKENQKVQVKKEKQEVIDITETDEETDEETVIDELEETIDNNSGSEFEEPEFGECCFCKDLCNPLSQACGSCMRSMSWYGSARY